MLRETTPPAVESVLSPDIPNDNSKEPTRDESGIKMRPTMKRHVKKDEQGTKNAFTKHLNNDTDEWVQKTFGVANVFPLLDEDIDINTLSHLVRNAYLNITTQPQYKVLRTKPGFLWHVEPTKETVCDCDAFAPAISSTSMRQRMYTIARYGGNRFILAVLFANICDIYANSGKLVYKQKNDRLTIVKDTIVAGYTTSGLWCTSTIPSIVLGEKKVPVDPYPDKHLTVWMKTRGMGILEVDLSDVNIEIRLRNEFPPEVSHPKQIIRHMRTTLVQQNNVAVIDNLIENVKGALKKYKRSAKEKRRKRDKRRKKKKVKNNQIE